MMSRDNRIPGPNSKLGARYFEAQQIIRAIEATRKIEIKLLTDGSLVGDLLDQADLLHFVEVLKVDVHLDMPLWRVAELLDQAYEARADAAWTWPWRRPKGIYDSDGPKEPTRVERDGHTFMIAANGDIGIDTGRDRFRVFCETCNELVHRGTTGPSAMAQGHLDKKSRERP
jgi:hypothetical protein